MAHQQQTPLYLAQGKGRGRGRRGPQNSQPQQPVPSAWNSGPPNNQGYRGGNGVGRGNNGRGNRPGGATPTWNKERPPQQDVPVKTAEERFLEASKPLKESVMHHMEAAAAGEDGGQGYESSSDEDLDDDKILSTTYEAYVGQIGDDGDSVDRSKQFLRDAWLSGASGCLVCLGKVKRIDAIWSCSECHCLLHLVCIQKWSKQCTMLQDLHSEQSTPSSKALWQCPKCRKDYPLSACPSRYLCFCGKETDPPAHPWLAPHTCEQTCERPLRPQCGHKCLLLCHPGPCPPCPKMVRTPCYCGQSTPQTRRCSTKEWTCGQICQQPLTCGQHMCQTPCHSGDCPPCDKTSRQRCLCGKDEQVRPCASPEWSCGKICGKVLSCGSHTCEKECHQQGECGDCPRTGQRSCPCGKTNFDLPCTEDIPNCGDTCEKLLSCGIHKCSQRCHMGECEKCRQMCTKKCRCGLREKSVLCYKEYLCDSKCSQMRDCTRHQCKRKCCDGSCPSCEQPCGKQLTCKNHKCQSRCHPGMCYPCPEIVEIKCNCGSTTITVPCGREKVTKPPRCNKKCSNPPDCHHPSRVPHRCHFGRCPPCRQMCAQQLLHCSHVCPKGCHSAVLVKQVENKPAPAGPWEAKPKAMLTMVNFPCPPCEVPIPTECLGKHEVTDLPCSSVAPFSCARYCGRLLDCGNHSCELACHMVTGVQKEHESGRECAQCEEGCSQPRPKGCTHTCLEPCHPDDCPPCQQGVRVRCHCYMMVLHKECSVWTAANKQEKKQLKSCDGPCPKQLTCGHQCSKICHDGDCSLPEECTYKKSIRCSCRRRKKEFLCKEIHIGRAKLECDDACKQAKNKKDKMKEEEKKKQEEEEKKRQQRDQDEYDRLMGKNKRRKQRKRSQTKELTFFEKNKKLVVILSTSAVILTTIIAFSLFKS